MPDFLRTAALIAALACASHTVAAQDQPANFVEWREGLHSSAQPSAQWLSQVKEKRYDVVINLAPPQSQGSLRDEGGIVDTSGVVYMNIPVDFSKPTAEDFRQFSGASDHAHHQEHDHDHQHQPQAAAGHVAPAAAVRPGGQRADENQQQDDQQDHSDGHCDLHESSGSSYDMPAPFGLR